ncbi:MAG: ASKHA domain-containing protein [Acetobacterium sp.]|nr:ASKHA domain-containing protein [Acetobacterium sp.]
MSSLNTIRVFFPLLDKSIMVEAGKTVAETCALIGFPQNLVCGGKGTCKKCLVTIRENDLVSEVLSCQHLISEDMAILISKEAAISQILETTNNGELSFNPKTRVAAIPITALKTEMCSYDLETIQKALEIPVKMSSIKVLQKSSEIFHQKNFPLMNFILYNDEIIDLIPANEALNAYGVAFDIGTTSVVGYLYDLTNGVLIHQYSSLNKQISFGGDVISRIDYASTASENLNRIHHAIIETVNNILSNLFYESKIPSEAVYECVFCGNSTMAHLFLGLNPLHLGLSPFTGVTREMVVLNAEELNININPSGKITFLPLLGGFVGADTTAVLLSLPKDDAYRLMIDLGTNGEIAVGNRNRYFVASTACGPALEGAGIHMGMRGTTGAIEKINLVNNEIKCQVIGDAPPLGFCGSGIIDAIAFLYREKLIYNRGNFIKGDDLDNHPFKDRFKTDENNQRYFVFVRHQDNPNGKEMIITQKDVRAVQLAKAAIFTGCYLLTEKYGIKGSDLQEIALAGAFGNYIDIENAQFIGLLPEIAGVPIRSIGNGAGTGSQLFLLSQDEAKRCEEIPKITTHIELATDPNFSHLYMQNTTLGQNEIK